MTISIVLSTYNGEKHIVEQLDSLKDQTISADEVLICDDCSTDDTVKIIKNYIEDHRLSNWSVTINNRNKGWKKNFYDLLIKAKGDIIFPCDQDDIWHLDKLEKMSKIMQNDPSILLLSSNYSPFYDGKGNTINLDHTDLDDSGRVYVPDFKRFFFYIRRPGCVYAINKSLITYFKEFHDDRDPHDALLWRLAAMLGGLRLYAYSTIDFRRHSNNATGEKVRGYLKRKEQIDYYYNMLQRLERFNSNYNKDKNENEYKIFKEYQKWIMYRKRLYTDRKLIYWFYLFKYRSLYWSIKSYFADLIIFIKGK